MVSFLKDRSGNFGIMFGLLMVPIMLAAGVVVDYTQATRMKSALQAALDAAALATASSEQADSKRIELGQSFFRAKFSVLKTGFDVSLETLPEITIDGDIVNATATVAVPTTFMHIAGYNTVDVTSLARAQVLKPNPCILLLEPTEIALTINSDAELNAANCYVQVNSSNRDALFVNASSKIVAKDICVTGNYRLTSGSTSTPTPTINCPAKADPLASLPEPSHGSCDFSDLVISDGQTRTLNPGVYCKKLEINSNAIAYLNPGTYFFPDTELIVNSNSELIGAGVMLFFSGEHGFLNVNSDSQVKLKGKTSGIYKGIVMFQSRASSSALAPPHIINADSTSYFEGKIYVPNGKLMMNSYSTLNQDATRTTVIARSMELNSLGTFVANNDNGGTPLADNMSMSRRVVLIK